VPLPESPPWYELFGSPLQQIYEVAATLHQLYRSQKPRFIPVCHQLLPSKPPTPALQAAQGEAAGESGATPLLGRPGRPLDPSVRRLVGEGSTRAAGATPGQVGAVLGGAAVGVWMLIVTAACSCCRWSVAHCVCFPIQLQHAVCWIVPVLCLLVMCTHTASWGGHGFVLRACIVRVLACC
jgi:hypothetical protein